MNRIEENGGFTISEVELPSGIAESNLPINILNPFYNESGVHFTLIHGSRVILTLYDATGKEVGILADKKLPSGECLIPFDRRKWSGGIYLYKLQAGGSAYTGKIVKP